MLNFIGINFDFPFNIEICISSENYVFPKYFHNFIIKLE